MLAPAAMAGAAAHGAVPGGTGPTGPPTNPSLYRYDGNKIGVQWTNGDATASTRVYFTDTDAACPSTFPDDVEPLKGTAGPGGTTFETGDPDTGDQCSYYVVHFKDNIFSTFVQVTDALDSMTCIACA